MSQLQLLNKLPPKFKNWQSSFIAFTNRAWAFYSLAITLSVQLKQVARPLIRTSKSLMNFIMAIAQHQLSEFFNLAIDDLGCYLKDAVATFLDVMGVKYAPITQ
ncbi:hypothetical protein [Moraxella oculi]|uniref:Transposase n=1 Tax=Moraxella oculi TaxID=2940516 RepID=A0ABW8UA86_9GAMM